MGGKTQRYVAIRSFFSEPKADNDTAEAIQHLQGRIGFEVPAVILRRA